jgi:hypothetical protein
MQIQYAAFEGARKIADGPLVDVALRVKARGEAATSGGIQIFDATGRVIDIDLRGSAADIENRLNPKTSPAPPRGPGRPRLGVVAREVTLLPRHWDWLNAQPGGASVALRKLVDGARAGNADADRKRDARDSAYRFMSAMAGDQAGFEEAIRALYAGHRTNFEAHTSAWPRDIRDHAAKMADAAFA